MPKAAEPLTVLGLEAAARVAKENGRRAELRDGTTRGLVALILADGRVTFGLRYIHDGQRKRMPLGEWKTSPAASGITLEAARRLAAKRLAEGDPKAEAKRRTARAAEDKARKERTLEKVAEAWLKSPEAEAWRPSTRREFERVVRREIEPALGALDPNDPDTRAEAAALVRRIAEGKPRLGTSKHPPKRGRRPKRSEPAPTMANRVLAILRALYRWALLEDQKRLGVTTDATAGLKRPHVEDAAPRVYTPAELQALITAAESIEDLRGLVPLLAQTMTRLAEARGARWPEFDFTEQTWTIPPERSKDGRPHVLPLSTHALATVQSLRAAQGVVEIKGADRLFPGRPLTVESSTRALWRSLSGVADATFHALRDTAAAELREAGYSSDVREDLLSHTPPKLHRAYQGEYRVSLTDRRRALETWGARLGEILGAAETSEKQA